MKTRKYLYIILACAAVFSAQSCLKDQKDVFEKPSSERMQNYCEDVLKTLTSEESGWVMEYYPKTGQGLGGYMFYLAFTSDTEIFGTAESPVKVVTAQSEQSNEPLVSMYKMTYDNGPVLSFDSYNDVLHYFATPSSSEYQAKGGDFEFSVMSFNPREIVLRGKRSGNNCTLIPFKLAKDVYYSHLDEAKRAEVTPTRFIADVKDMAGKVRAATLSGTVNGQPVTGTMDLDNRRVKFNLTPENEGEESEGEESEEGEEESGEIVEMPFIFTPRGIKAYDNAEIAGYRIHELFYFPLENVLTDYVVTFQGEVPKDYAAVGEFSGNFTLSYGKGRSLDITIENVDGKNLLLKGLNPNFDVKLTYDSARGRLRMLYQVLGNDGTYTIGWCPCNDNYLTWMEGAGMEIYLDVNDANRNTFRFCDNGAWGSDKCDSFILYCFDSSGDPVTVYDAWGEYLYPYFESLTRKK